MTRHIFNQSNRIFHYIRRHFLFLKIFFLIFFLQLNVYPEKNKEYYPTGIWRFNYKTSEYNIKSIIIISSLGIFGMNTEIEKGKAKYSVYSGGIWVNREEEINKYFLLILEIKPNYLIDKIDFSKLPSFLEIHLYAEKELMLSNKFMKRRYHKIK